MNNKNLKCLFKHTQNNFVNLITNKIKCIIKCFYEINSLYLYNYIKHKMHTHSVLYNYIILQLYEIYFTKLSYNVILTRNFREKNINVIYSLKKKKQKNA